MLELLPLHVYSPELLNPIALRKAKIAYNFGLSECNRVKAYFVVDNSSFSYHLFQMYLKVLDH